MKVPSGALARNASFMSRFQRRAQVLAALKHPNIAQLCGLQQNAIVMELVEGHEPLGPSSLGELLDLARLVAKALGRLRTHSRRARPCRLTSLALPP